MAPPFTQKATKAQEQQIKASQARTSKDAIEKALDTARGRKEFFSNRPDVSDDRALRRMKQADETQRFKNLYTKPVAGSSNLLQMTADAPRSLAAERERLARKYGPTFKEIGSDIGFGLGSIAKGFAEKGTPMFQLVKGLGSKIKTGVERAWDAVRGEPTTVQGTAFPQPSSDIKDLFSPIDTGVAGVNPDNMLVQIAKANEGRFDDKPTFQEQLANATAQNLTLPDPRKVGETITDYITAAQRGVNVDTPIGNVNINPLTEKIFLDGGIGDIRYGGSLDPNTLDYNVGVGTQLPYGVNFSAGASSSDIPGMSFNKNIGPINTSFNLSEQGGSLGLNTVVDPLRAIFPGSSIGTPINVGASVDSKGNVIPSINLMVPFNSSGLGYMFK